MKYSFVRVEAIKTGQTVKLDKVSWEVLGVVKNSFTVRLLLATLEGPYRETSRIFPVQYTILVLTETE